MHSTTRLHDGVVMIDQSVMKVSGRNLAKIASQIEDEKQMHQLEMKFNQDELIIKRYANHPIVGWAHVDDSGKVYSDMAIALERGDGAVFKKSYLLRNGLIGFFSHEGLDFGAFFDTEFAVLYSKQKLEAEFKAPHQMGMAVSNQAGFDLLYGLQHNERYVRSVWLTMPGASYEEAQGVVRKLCVYFMRALPSDMQHEMDGMLPNGWWLEN